MNTYIPTEGKNLKKFSKEYNALALRNCDCYLFTKFMLNMELEMILIVLMEFVCIWHS